MRGATGFGAGRRLASSPAAGLELRSGDELVLLSEELHRRLFALALLFVPFTCALALVVAVAKVRQDHLLRTAALAGLITVIGGYAAAVAPAAYRAMRRHLWPTLVLPSAVLGAALADGMIASTFYFPAVVALAPIAAARGRRATVAVALLLALGWGALTWAAGYPPDRLRDEGELITVVAEVVSLPVWALLLCGLADRLTAFSLRLNRIAAGPGASARAPVPVANLARHGDPDTAGGDGSPAPTPPRRPPQADPLAPLTARQLQVVALPIDGLRAAEIAARLGVAEGTVHRYVERAKRRVGVATRAELVALAVGANLVTAGRSAPERT